jgi:hypothetical protein
MDQLEFLDRAALQIFTAMVVAQPTQPPEALARTSYELAELLFEQRQRRARLRQSKAKQQTP